MTLCTSTLCSRICCTSTSINASTYLLNTLHLLTHFSKSAELTRQLSAPQCSARISSVLVTRFLFPPSHNPSDVAFKLLTMLTFLIVSPPNFAISSSRPSLHTLTSTLHGASPLLSTPTLGTLRFASPHSLALQASSLLLGVTPILHFKHVVRSLTMPWKFQ